MKFSVAVQGYFRRVLKKKKKKRKMEIVATQPQSHKVEYRTVDVSREAIV